jgi:alkylation response protein AidB-like acyl-CoA dehydrogenase
MAKLFTEEMVIRVSEKALRLHGGVGYTQEYPIERMFRDCRSFHFEEGTAEIQKLVISRELLKG